MNKTRCVLFLMSFLPVLLFTQTLPELEIVCGGQMFQPHSNYLQNYQIPEWDTKSTKIKPGWGFKVDLLMPAKKISSLKYVFGATYQTASLNKYSDEENPKLVPYLFGGGLYAGVSAQTGSEHFGLFGQICPGYFIFNQKVNLIESSGSPNNSTIINHTTSTFGSKVSIGLYDSRGKFSIYPSLYCILMGLTDKGTNALLGIDLSISYKH